MRRPAKHTSRRRNVLKTIGAGGAAALAGCLGTGLGTDDEDETLRIALMVPQSGPYAVYGEDGGKAADLAEQELNEADEGPEIEIIPKDTEADPETAVNRAREAVQEDNADVLLGFASSSVALSVSEFGAGQDVISVSTIAQTPRLTGEDCQRQTFRTAGDLVQINRGASRAVIEMTDIESDWTIAAIYPDYVFGHETWAAFNEDIHDQVDGLEVVTEQAPAFGKGEYQNEIQSLANAEPDLIYTSLSGSDMIAFVEQASGVGLFDEIEEFVHVSGAITDTSRALGDDMVEMIAADRYFYQFPDTERNREFVEAFEDMHGEIPVNTAQETYAGIYGAHAAVQEGGGTDVDSMVEGFRGLEFEAPEGTKRIRTEDHQSIEPNIWVGRIGPVDYADFYGYTDMNPIPGEDVIPEPTCDMPD